MSEPRTYIASCSCGRVLDVPRQEVVSGRAPKCKCGRMMVLYARRTKSEDEPKTPKPKAIA
jgi:hypothetical protein